MNNNHPSRNWRARMRAAADQWLHDYRQHGYGYPQPRAGSTAPAAVLLTPEQLDDLMRAGYVAGYADGRKRTP